MFIGISCAISPVTPLPFTQVGGAHARLHVYLSFFIYLSFITIFPIVPRVISQVGGSHARSHVESRRLYHHGARRNLWDRQSAPVRREHAFDTTIQAVSRVTGSVLAFELTGPLNNTYLPLLLLLLDVRSGCG